MDQGKMEKLGVRVVGIYPIDPSPWHLVEVVLTNVDGFLDFGVFVQPDPELPKENWQVAYDEQLLDDDGQLVVSDLFMTARHRHSNLWKGTMRCAFFLFGYKPWLPFFGPTGLLDVPAISSLPERLRAMKFEEP